MMDLELDVNDAWWDEDELYTEAHQFLAFGRVDRALHSFSHQILRYRRSLVSASSERRLRYVLYLLKNLVSRGNVYLELSDRGGDSGLIDDSLKDFEDTIATADQYGVNNEWSGLRTDAMCGTAECFRRMNSINRSLMIVNEILKNSPKHPFAHYTRAMILKSAKVGTFQAIEDFQLCIIMGFRTHECLMERIRLRMQLNQIQAGLQDARALLQLDPENIQVKRWIAEMTRQGQQVNKRGREFINRGHIADDSIAKEGLQQAFVKRPRLIQ